MSSRRNATLVQRFGNHEAGRTTKLYERTGDEITLDETSDHDLK